jgi:hypothetical protein
MHYGWGKPAERVELGGPGAFTDDLSELSLEQLEQRGKEVITDIIALQYSTASPDEKRLLEARARSSTDLALSEAERRHLQRIDSVPKDVPDGSSERSKPG